MCRDATARKMDAAAPGGVAAGRELCPWPSSSTPPRGPFCPTGAAWEFLLRRPAGLRCHRSGRSGLVLRRRRPPLHPDRLRRFFETSDFESWKPAPGLEPPEQDVLLARPLPNLPEPNAQARAADGFYARLYAFGRQVYRSEDGGLSWVNRTASHGESIIGNGVLRSGRFASRSRRCRGSDRLLESGARLDGGLSWYGLNDTLPNLPVRSLLSAPAGSRGTRVLLESGAALEWEPGERQSWRAVNDRATAPAGRCEVCRQSASR